jgi:spermidine synthase
LVALGPPCVAMGATLPLMARAIVGRERRLGRRVAGVYGINTVGAVVGVIAAGFFLPLWIGTHGSVLLAAGINVLVAVVALLVSLGRTEQIDEPEAEPTLKPASMPDPEAGEAARRWDPAILFAAAASGFGTLALEVLFTRMIVNATDSSVFSFAMMLATFLICLALGSFIVSLWVDRMARPWRFLAWTQSIAAITIMASPFVFRLAGVTLRVPRILPGYDYLIWLLMFSALVMGPTVLLVGVMLPTVWKLATRRSAQVGRNVGLLTGLNTFTAVLGSAAAGFLIIPLTGVNFGIVVIAMLYGAVAMVCWLRGYEGGKRAAGLITVGLALAFLYDRGIWTPLPVAPRPPLPKRPRACASCRLTTATCSAAPAPTR